jgi:AcrR family transcriptional regulator
VIADEILDAAEAVALEHGLEAATTAAIAERAGVAVGTLYNYFPDREGLLTALLRARKADIAPRIAAAAEAASKLSFEPRLRSFVTQMLEIFETRRGFLKLIASDPIVANLKHRHLNLMAQVLLLLEQIMRDGAARRLFPAARVPALARMLQGSMRGLVMWRIADGGSLAADANLLVDHFLHGARGA